MQHILYAKLLNKVVQIWLQRGFTSHEVRRKLVMKIGNIEDRRRVCLHQNVLTTYWFTQFEVLIVLKASRIKTLSFYVLHTVRIV